MTESEYSNDPDIRRGQEKIGKDLEEILKLQRAGFEYEKRKKQERDEELVRLMRDRPVRRPGS
jgi:hypothetical protein